MTSPSPTPSLIQELVGVLREALPYVCEGVPGDADASMLVGRINIALVKAEGYCAAKPVDHPRQLQSVED